MTNIQSSNIKKPRKKPKAIQRDEEYLKYRKYIKSKEFKEIKGIVEERDGGKCCACNSTRDERTLTCHHKTYEHLYNEREHLEDLITLCNVCHRAIHNAVSNYKRFKRTEK
jgi:5-methylcytosine-specific restriction endonuclease McrA